MTETIWFGILAAAAAGAALLVTRIGGSPSRYACGTCQARFATDVDLAAHEAEHGLPRDPQTDPRLTIAQQRHAVRILGGRPRRYIPGTWEQDGDVCYWGEANPDGFSLLACHLSPETQLLLDELQERP